MCGIYGGVGYKTALSDSILTGLRANAADRGRDGGNLEYFLASPTEAGPLAGHVVAAMGSWRGTPTPEVEQAPLQPYHGILHNGTIANDRELGARPGEVDSMVLARVLDRSSPQALAHSLQKVIGSYALAVWTGTTILLATNYKPLYFAQIEGAMYFASMARHFQGLLPYGQAPVALPQYTVLDLLTGDAHPIHCEGNHEYPLKALVICSGGLDSTTVAHFLKARGDDVTLLHFLYGAQAETRETQAVQKLAQAMHVPYVFLSLDFKAIAGASPLVGGNPDQIAPGLEGAEFAHEWVPARNLVMLALATAYAESHGYHHIALGNNLEEAGAYPDNEEEFTTRFGQLLPYATKAHYHVGISSPVGHLMKHEIVKLGLSLGTPYHLTWSCYRGGSQHCGECGPCFMRREAFKRNGQEDPVFLASQSSKGA